MVRFFSRGSCDSSISLCRRLSLRSWPSSVARASRYAGCVCPSRSACSTIRILYSRVKLRRLATATTSGSESAKTSRPEKPLRSLRSLRGSSVTALADPKTSTSFMIVPNPFPALLTNISGVRCLTHVGTEGCWLEKQPEGPSRKSARGVEVRPTCAPQARIDRTIKGTRLNGMIPILKILIPA